MESDLFAANLLDAKPQQAQQSLSLSRFWRSCDVQVNQTMAYPKATLALVALIGSSKAQTEFFDAPQPTWTTTFLPMADNNGIVWAPDDSLIYATSSDGTLGLFNPDDGTLYNQFQPSGDGTTPFFCTGEVSFNSAGDTVIYAVTEGDTW